MTPTWADLHKVSDALYLYLSLIGRIVLCLSSLYAAYTTARLLFPTVIIVMPSSWLNYFESVNLCTRALPIGCVRSPSAVSSAVYDHQLCNDMLHLYLSFLLVIPSSRQTHRAVSAPANRCCSSVMPLLMDPAAELISMPLPLTDCPSPTALSLSRIHDVISTRVHVLDVTRYQYRQVHHRSPTEGDRGGEHPPSSRPRSSSSSASPSPNLGVPVGMG